MVYNVEVKERVMMKRYTCLVLFIGLFLLGACANQTETDSETSTTQTSEAALLKTRVFEVALEDGNRQTQTVIYKNNEIQKLVLKNTLTVTDAIRQSIAEIGLAETKKQIQESMDQDESYRQLSGISGLSYEMDLTENQEFFVTFTLERAELDVAALTASSIFSGSEIDDITILTAEQYIERLKNRGIEEVSPPKEDNPIKNLP